MNENVKSENTPDEGPFDTDAGWCQRWANELLKNAERADSSVEMTAIQYGEARGRRNMLQQIIGEMKIVADPPASKSPKVEAKECQTKPAS